VMVCGMATIAGTVMALYGAILGPVVPDAIGHIFIASIVATPAAITVAALMVPGPVTRAENVAIERQDTSAMDAVTRGTVEGAMLLIHIVAMLIVLIALVALANALLGLAPDFAGAPLTLQRMFGWLFAPLAWTTGVAWSEAQAAGQLLGTKAILNEFVAYLDLAKLPAESMSERSRLLMTYALCGFANLGSVGILIGGMGAMVPQRRAEIVDLGMKSIVAGTIATCMTAAVVGLFV
jgi:concentrative nucleoside transporter, CNT family